MLAAVFKSIKTIEVEDYSMRLLGENELLIGVTNCGICGTDKHIYEGNAPSKIPIILGHEYSGIVIDTGTIKSNFHKGDKVVIDPNIYCGYCDYCRKGKVNFCQNHAALGVTMNGGFAEYSIVPVSQAYHIPKDFDLSIAAFAEPLSCCLRGMEHASVKFGDTVIVLGGGSIGLMMIQLVKNAGAAKIILLEPSPFKQKIGLELGADYAFDPNEIDILEKIDDLTKGGADICIECVGKKEIVELSVKLAGKGSKVVIFGLAPSDHNVSLNLQNLFQKELKIFNSFLNPYTFKSAVDLLVEGKINVQKLISKHLFLENIINVFNTNFDSHIIKQQFITN